MKSTRVSRVTAIATKCRDCIYDPLAVGTWREQVAACVSANCALHAVRPVPRACLRAGEPDPVAIAALRENLDARQRAKDNPEKPRAR